MRVRVTIFHCKEWLSFSNFTHFHTWVVISLLSLLILNIFRCTIIIQFKRESGKTRNAAGNSTPPSTERRSKCIAEKDLVDLLVSVYDTFCSFKGTNYARLRNIWQVNLRRPSCKKKNEQPPAPPICILHIKRPPHRVFRGTLRIT